MKLRLNENVLRVTLIVFSIIFGILSVSLIALGIIYIDDLWWPRKFIGLDFLALPTLVIVLGSISFVMSLIGCFCAKSYNKKLFTLFLVSLLIILILELSIAVIAFKSKGETKHRKIRERMTEYLQTNALAELEDNCDCCGVTGTEDYCVGQTPVLTTDYIQGCYQKTISLVDIVATRVGFYTTALMVFQVLNVFITICLFKIIK